MVTIKGVNMKTFKEYLDEGIKVEIKKNQVVRKMSVIDIYHMMFTPMEIM